MSKYTRYIVELVASIANGDFSMPLRHILSRVLPSRFLASHEQSRSFHYLTRKFSASPPSIVAHVQRLKLDSAFSSVCVVVVA
jgi:hypothetical protein